MAQPRPSLAVRRFRFGSAVSATLRKAREHTVKSGSRAVKDGSIGGLIQSAAERWKPEAMHFGTFDGHRTAFMVFDIPDSSDMVPFGEPFLMALDADVEVVPVMNADDLQKGFGRLLTEWLWQAAAGCASAGPGRGGLVRWHSPPLAPCGRRRCRFTCEATTGTGPPEWW